MKKILSLALIFAASMSVNAQEVCQIDAESAGITSEAATIAAGTVVGTSEHLTMSIAFDDQVKSAACKMKNAGFLIGGAEVKHNGISGTNNPKIDGTNMPAAPTMPNSGFCIQIKPTADGYVYVCGKLSSNKAYYVLEEGVGIGYELSMYCDNATDSRFLPVVITVDNDTQETIDGVTFNSRTGDVDQVEKIVLGSEWTSAIKLNGEGVIKFPVVADCTYTVFAAGSKISVCGAVFSTDGNLSVVLPETTDETAGTTEPAHNLFNTTTGINIINAATASDVTAPAYNMVGQRVNRNAKGLVICNGKKFINK